MKTSRSRLDGIAGNVGERSPSFLLERRKTERILLLLIFLFGLVLRFSELDQESLWYDEALSIQTAHSARLADLVERSKSENETAPEAHPPLFFLLLRQWMKLFGDTEPAARALSAAIGVLTPLALFGLGRSLSLPGPACLLGAFLYALNTQAIWYSQEVRMYSLISLLGTICLALTALHLRPRQLFGKPRLLTAAWWAAGVLCVYTHFFGIFFMAASGLAVLWKALQLWRAAGVSESRQHSRRRDAARRLVVRLAAVSAGWLLAALPLVLVMLSRIKTGFGIDWLAEAKVGWDTPWRIVGGLVVGEQIAGGPDALRSATKGAFLVVALVPFLGILGGRIRRSRWGLPFFWALILAGIPMLISIVRPIIMGGTRYVSIAGAPLCLAGAVGLHLLWRGRWFGRALTAATLCLVLASDAAYLSEYYGAREKRMWREAVALVNAEDRSAPMVAVPDHMAVVLRYYERGTRPIVGWSQLEREKERHDRFWVMAEGIPTLRLDPPWVVRKSRVVTQSFSVTSVTVFLIERTGVTPTAPADPPAR